MKWIQIHINYFSFTPSYPSIPSSSSLSELTHLLSLPSTLQSPTQPSSPRNSQSPLALCPSAVLPPRPLNCAPPTSHDSNSDSEWRLHTPRVQPNLSSITTASSNRAGSPSVRRRRSVRPLRLVAPSPFPHPVTFLAPPFPRSSPTPGPYPFSTQTTRSRPSGGRLHLIASLNPLPN